MRTLRLTALQVWLITVTACSSYPSPTTGGQGGSPGGSPSGGAGSDGNVGSGGSVSSGGTSTGGGSKDPTGGSTTTSDASGGRSTFGGAAASGGNGGADSTGSGGQSGGMPAGGGAVATGGSFTNAGGAGDGGAGSFATGGNGGTCGAGGSSTVDTGGTCSDVTSCGGSLDGAWQVDSMCFQGDITSVMNTMMTHLPACRTIVQKVSTETPTGSLTYSGGKEISDIVVTLDMQMLITQECASAMSGNIFTLSGTCESPQMQQLLLSNGQFSSGPICSYVSSECRCQATYNHRKQYTLPYTVSGNNFLYSDGGYSVGYCVFNGMLTEKWTTGDLGDRIEIWTFHRIP